MNLIGMREWLRPKLLAPLHGELLGQFFARELKAHRTRPLFYALEVAEFVEENVVEHESPDCQRGPLMTASGTELLARLTTFHKGCLQAHSGR